MAPRSKKRLSKNENMLLKLDKLRLEDILCSICQSILIEPVTLPCFHSFCQSCFNGSIENNALCCPLCRLRIGSWLRTTTKQKNLVNIKLWKYITNKFSREIESKLNGETLNILEEKTLPRLSAPGEIRSEYEAELERLRVERLQLEQKHLQKTELLIKKIQEEEEEVHKIYLERLKQDQFLVKKIAQQANDQILNPSSSTSIQNPITLPDLNSELRLKSTRIDSYFSKQQTPAIKDSPLTTINDCSSTDSYATAQNQVSPELVPSYGKYLKQYSNKKFRVTSMWNKKNGDNKVKNELPVLSHKVTEDNEKKCIVKGKSIQSLLVSLPYTGILQHKAENRKKNSSVDSLGEELCYFKPIDETATTSYKPNSGLPLRVAGVRTAAVASGSLPLEPAPTRDQYVAAFCRLRRLSLACNLPSAFVLAHRVLRVNKETSIKCETNTTSKYKKNLSTSSCGVHATDAKGNTSNKNNIKINGITKLNKRNNSKRTKSTSSISKDASTPKKAETTRKAISERKPYLRSDSKKINSRNDLITPPVTTINNNKIKLAVKNLSSPIESCDVKLLMEEQLKIESMLEQEKNDYELARKLEAEWNGKRHPRQAHKRREPAPPARPAKKLKA